MKTTKFSISKLNRVLIVVLSIFMISCSNDENSKVMISNQTAYPIPSENPVYFTAEAQTKNVFVKNITWIIEENPDTDIVEQTDMSPRWIVIKNDWIKIRYNQDITEEDAVEITVNENTSKEPRIYNLLVHGSPAPGINVTLQIIQEGVK